MAPVVNPTLTPAGNPNRSASQAPATSSATAAAGPMTYSPAFWSHAEVSQSAPSAAGSDPPITNPKNRGPALAMRPSIGGRHERVHRGGGILAGLRERAAEARPKLRERRRRGNPPDRQAVEPPPRVHGRPLEGTVRAGRWDVGGRGPCRCSSRHGLNEPGPGRVRGSSPGRGRIASTR